MTRFWFCVLDDVLATTENADLHPDLDVCVYHLYNNLFSNCRSQFLRDHLGNVVNVVHDLMFW